MTATGLDAWLEKLEQRSPESRIELGLTRVAQVHAQLAIGPISVPVITVAGTNGKGSTVAFLEAICAAAGLATFAYTSPHLVTFGERMRIDGQPSSDARIVAALERVEQARDAVVLTYFEHITLAALALVDEVKPDVLILEVGLGGRLDAVNVIDPDVAVITSIGLDHTNWLGRTRLAIGREKAGIARPGRPLVIGEKRMPTGLAETLEAKGIAPLRAGRDFYWRRQPNGWVLRTPLARRRLPLPSMAGGWQFANAACAVTALDCLAERLPIPDQAINQGIESARVAGRLQRVATRPEVLIDVAHNPAAARALAKTLGSAEAGRIAVFGSLVDKDVVGVVKALNPCFDHWILASLEGNRGQSAESLAARLAPVTVMGTVETVESVSAALARAREKAGPDGRIVVFGSFLTVAEAWHALELLK